MLELLWMVPALPFAACIALAVFGRSMPARAVSQVGTGGVGIAAVLTAVLAGTFPRTAPAFAFTQSLWRWMDAGDLHVDVALRLDPLSLVMTLVVTGVGLLILLYSTAYMRGDAGYARFFAYMNLFVGSMLVLVLADTLPLLYLGWEGVGVCSYLLIGFWYDNPGNVRAATKAFIVTRIGDVAMLVGLFVLFSSLGTLDIQTAVARAQTQWTPNSGIAIATAALLLGGAIGKSGQVPLQVWLPDAMAGPTPVSALIHAATMVAAGVYLLARMHAIFALAPAVQCVVAGIGAATLLLAGCSALAQRDIKRALAYSTISQLGYMFLALGVGAWQAAIFHFMTHAFFKALLFMGAGAVILALHHEQDMFKMGGLRKQLPLVFRTFLIGAGSLAALPLITAGFYSKDKILWETLISPQGGVILWAAGAIGAFITALYAFRIVGLVFFGEAKTDDHKTPLPALHIPLVVLAGLTTVAGFLDVPRTLGNRPTFSTFLALPGTIASADAEPSRIIEAGQQGIVTLLVLCGVAAACALFVTRTDVARRWTASVLGGAVHRTWAAGWGFDAFYNGVFVRPFLALARSGRNDFIGNATEELADASVTCGTFLCRLQTGQIRWYMAGITLGAVIVLALMVLL